MATKASRRPLRRAHEIHKPNGSVHPRVQKLGPQHFGIVAVDCAKARSKWMLADFYGNVLVPPTEVEHARPTIRAAIDHIRQTCNSNQILDLIVAVERTGRYHQVIRDAFRKAGFDTRIVHPFATKQFRQPADPGNKTDDTDLSAIHRAAVNGFGLVEPVPESLYIQLKLLARHRRDLVRKTSKLRCQIREHLNVFMTGFDACFADPFNGDIAMTLARRLGSPRAVRDAGADGLGRIFAPRASGSRSARSTAFWPGPSMLPIPRRTPRSSNGSPSPWRTIGRPNSVPLPPWRATWPNCWPRRRTCSC